MESEPRILHLSPEETLAIAMQEARMLLQRPGRNVLGIAGGPGAGKSTLATRLVEALGSDAAYVPMDGFHMRHSKLEQLGAVADKGMPHTFEGAAFVEFLAALKTASGTVKVPGYSRAIEDVVEDAIEIPATSRLLVTEGNYLLLASGPWWQLRPLLDRAVYIEAPREVVRTRLMRRHAAEGLFTAERNLEHIERVDLPNGELVRRSRSRADLVIEVETEE